jgi:hypothetical protein
MLTNNPALYVVIPLAMIFVSLVPVFWIIMKYELDAAKRVPGDSTCQSAVSSKVVRTGALSYTSDKPKTVSQI